MHPVVDGIPQITVEELKRKLDAKEDVFVLDVREPHEYPIANLGAPLIPVGEVGTPRRLNSPHKRIARSSFTAARALAAKRLR